MNAHKLVELHTHLEYILNCLREMPPWFIGSIELVKEIQADINEVEACDREPDVKLQNLVEEAAQQLHNLEECIHSAQADLVDVIKLCGWDVKLDEKNDRVIIDGEVWEDTEGDE